MMKKLLFICAVMGACIMTQAKERTYSDYQEILDIAGSIGHHHADFTVDGLYYTIVSPTEVMVTRGGVNAEESTQYMFDKDLLVIPSEVEYESIHYQVIGVASNTFSGPWDGRPGTMGKTDIPICEIIVSEGIEVIGYKAFGYLRRLQSVSLPTSLRYLGNSVFYGCRSLSSITIPEGIKWTEPSGYYSGGGGMFYDCGFSSLDDIKNSENLKEALNGEIPYNFIAGEHLRSIRIPDWVESIGEHAFMALIGNMSLKYVYIPNSVKKISSYAFGDSFGTPIGYFEDKNGKERFRYEGSNPVVIIDNHQDLAIYLNAFGASDSDGGAVRNQQETPPTIFFMGDKPPVTTKYWIGGGWDDNYPLVFVPSGLKDAYSEAGIDGPESGVINGLNEFDSSILSNYKCLLVVRQGTEGGKVKINGEELTGTLVKGMEEGTPLNIEFIPDEGYQLKHFYWNHNYQDETMGVLEDGMFKTVMTGNSRLDFFFTSTTGITPTKETDGKVQYYSVEGQRLSSPQKGITIIKTNDGKPKKVVTKGN